jgi:hypothetical protein
LGGVLALLLLLLLTAVLGTGTGTGPRLADPSPMSFPLSLAVSAFVSFGCFDDFPPRR